MALVDSAGGYTRRRAGQGNARLTTERELLGLTLEQAAEQIGVATGTLWRAENAVGELRPTTAKRIADYYDKEARAAERPRITIAHLWPHGLRSRRPPPSSH